MRNVVLFLLMCFWLDVSAQSSIDVELSRRVALADSIIEETIPNIGFARMLTRYSGMTDDELVKLQLVNDKKALDAIEAVVELDPYNEKCLSEKARILLRRGQLAETLNIYYKLMEREDMATIDDPIMSTSYTRKVVDLYIDNKLFDEAFSLVLKRYPLIVDDMTREIFFFLVVSKYEENEAYDYCVRTIGALLQYNPSLDEKQADSYKSEREGYLKSVATIH